MCEYCGCGKPDAPPSIRREIKVAEDVFAENNEIAAAIRHSLEHRGTLMLNFLSAPGSGKTLLLEKSLPILMKEYSVAALEGDVQTRYDAERLRRHKIPAVQVNTGGACHLDAESVRRVLTTEPFETADLIVIENVGNLVCPAAFDLGEDAKIVAVSVTEGDDKPEKYPGAFAVAGAMLITKTDLLPHVSFDVEKCKAGAWQIHPGLPVMALSAQTGQGLETWLAWIRHLMVHKKNKTHAH